MSLAARCPACATVFRVVQDQLRVSEGWVRCGRCSEVFNAIENLVDLDADVANLPSTRSPERERPNDAGARSKAAASPHADHPPWPRPAAAEQAPEKTPAATQRPTSQPGRTLPPQAAPAPVLDASAADRDTNTEFILTGGSRRLEGAQAAEPAADAQEALVAERPAFVRRAERAARWRRPAVRAALCGLVAAGLVGLSAQGAFAYRDLLAARWPATQPLLHWACRAAGCVIEAPRAIDAIAVESSGLVRIDGTPMYRLSVVLRSRATLALALPAIDLTLTDSQGGVIARRVIPAAEFGVFQSSLPALAELPLQATIGAGERAISGYTIEIFYP